MPPEVAHRSNIIEEVEWSCSPGPDNMSATAKLITKYVDRLRRLRSLQNAITVKEFRAIMATDSVRPTIIQVIHSGEEAI